MLPTFKRESLEHGIHHIQGHTYVVTDIGSAHDEYLRWCQAVGGDGVPQVDYRLEVATRGSVVYRMPKLREITKEQPVNSDWIKAAHSYLTFIASGGADEPMTHCEDVIIKFVKYDPRCIPILKVEVFAMQQDKLVLFNPVSHNDATVLVTQ